MQNASLRLFPSKTYFRMKQDSIYRVRGVPRFLFYVTQNTMMAQNHLFIIIF